MARKLKDIMVEEISFVDRPANRKAFLVIKGEEAMKEKLIELLKAFGRQEPEELSNVDKLPEETQTVLVKAFDTFMQFKPDMPQELLDAHADVVEVIAAIVPVEKQESEDQTQESADAEQAQKEEPEEVLKQLKALMEKAQTFLKEDSEEDASDDTNTDEEISEEEEVNKEEFSGDEIKSLLKEVLMEATVETIKGMVNEE